MAMPYVGLYMGPADGAALDFRKRLGPRRWQVRYTPAPAALERASLNEKFVAPALPLVLIEGSTTKDEVVLHPTMLDANSPNFLGPRHDPIKTVTLVGFGLDHVNDLDDVIGELERLPTGFVHSPYRGLGLNYDIRQIVDTVAQAKGVSDLRIAKGLRGEPTLEGGSLILPYTVFEAARLDIGRIHTKALGAARAEKTTRLSDRILHPIDPQRFPVIGQPYHPDAIVRAVGDGIRRGIELSPADSSMLIEAATGLIGEVAQREPRQLLKLTEAVETVTLEAMIDHMKARIAESHGEENWQKFLKDNAFILRLAFGIPVLLFKDQATVGGRAYDGAGDKRTDFLMQAASSGNLAIVEIKKPTTGLLAKDHYRVGVHAPHHELSGAVNQVLDQRWQLQRSNVQMADDYRRRSAPAGSPEDGEGPQLPPETYAIQCVVIAGTMPEDLNLRKSFELFRNALNGVVVITYDELLLKLQSLLRLLKDPGAKTLAIPCVTTKRPKRRKPGPRGLRLRKPGDRR